MADPIAQAFLAVYPDTTRFAALLQLEVTAAVRKVVVPPIVVPITAVPAAGLQAAAASAAATAQTVATANQQVAASTAAAGSAFKVGASEANLWRGSLIGISRVTPVTVFGLGLVGTAAAAAGLAATAAVSSFASLERQLNIFAAVSGATAAQMEQVSDLAHDLGADLKLPSVSAGDAATALTELAKAGLSVEDAMDAARAVLQLSIAANLSAGDAAEIVATQLNAFNLAGTEAARVANLLAGASIAAQGEIGDFGAAFQQAAAVANQAGVSVEQTTGLLTILAQEGLRSSDAGTSLRTTLLRLTPTTKQAAEFARTLGVELDQTKDIGGQLTDVIDQYRQALSLLTPIQRQQALAQIFGQDAIRAASILFSQQSGALDDVIAKTSEKGQLDELAAAQAAGLSGALEGLRSNLDTLGVTLASFVAGPIESVVRGFSLVTSATVEAIEAIQRYNEAVLGLVPGDRSEGGLEDQIRTLVTGSVPEQIDNFVGRVKHLIDILDGVDDAGQRAAISAQKGIQAQIDQFAAVAGVEGFLQRVQEAGQKQTDQIAALARLGLTQQFGETLDQLQARLVAKAQALGQAVSAGLDAELAKTRLQQFISAAEAAGLTAAEAINEAFRTGIKIETIDVLIPIDLRIEVLEAGISGSLLDQRAAQQAVVTRLEKNLAKIPEEAKVRREKVLTDLAAANSALASINNQIEAEQKKAQSERERVIRDAQSAFEKQIQNEATRLEIAAAAADHQGKAETAYLNFLRRQVDNARLSTEDQLRFQKELASELKRQADAAAEAQQAQEELRLERLDLAILRAEVITPNNVNDEIKRVQEKIAVLKKLHKEQLKLAKDDEATRQQRLDAAKRAVELETDILHETQRLRQLRDQGSGRDIDIFAEAIQNFAQFGSNVAGAFGVLSPQDVRGVLASNILAGASAQQTSLTTGVGAGVAGGVGAGLGMLHTQEQRAQVQRDSILTEAQRQTELLRTIAVAVGGDIAVPDILVGRSRQINSAEAESLRRRAVNVSSSP